jgi:hypothetical protein
MLSLESVSQSVKFVAFYCNHTSIICDSKADSLEANAHLTVFMFIALVD